MTEQEWLNQSASWPEYMFGKVVGRGRARLSRLGAVACCRRISHLLPDPPCLPILEWAEEYADKPKGKDRFLSETIAVVVALWDTVAVTEDGFPRTNGDGVSRNALQAVRELASQDGLLAMHYAARAAAVATLTAGREYDDAIDPDLLAIGREKVASVAIVRDLLRQRFVPVTPGPSWRTQDTVPLAQAANAERSLPLGELDPVRLSVLADALEEAGCTDEAILSHLRSPGPHVRGCWAVDLVLGKE